jgi:7-cyano-7-deazaguanine synthase
MKNVVVLLSGGLDSTTLLYHHVKGGDNVKAISFNYGQRHSKELAAAEHVCRSVLRIPYKAVDVTMLRNVLHGSSQTDVEVDVPSGKYDEESMKATVVPNRNMILLSIAIGWAIAEKMDYVSYAAHAGDHAIYPDCRPEFADVMNVAAGLCDWRKIELLRPFIRLTKSGIVKLGRDLGVDYFGTWSCYRGASIHCGTCGTCIERREAFYLAGVSDPTIYSPSAPTVPQMVANDWKLPLVQ